MRFAFSFKNRKFGVICNSRKKMSTQENTEYEAILVDTSIFYALGLKLEKGLLGKLYQFKDSETKYLLPDVIKSEVQRHLEVKVRKSRAALEKSLKDAGDYLFFEGSELIDAKAVLIESKEIEGVAKSRVDNFIENSGALVLECGDYVSVSELLTQYFKNAPPFAVTGKKKFEFPDAIVLLAADAWAKEYGVNVIAVSTDPDWKGYCETTDNIDYTQDLADALSKFNKETAHFSFLSNLVSAIDSGEGNIFVEKVRDLVEGYFSDFTPDQEADSVYYWEADGCHGWLSDFALADANFKIVDHDENSIVLKVNADITVEVEGEFSLSQHGTVSRDNVHMVVTNTAEEEFTSEILITVIGDLTGNIAELTIDRVEVVSPIKSVDFGTLEPDCSEYI